MKRANIQPLRDRQRPGGDQFAGLRADDGGAENSAFLVGDDLDVTVRLALGLGAVIIVIRPAQDADFDAALARLRLGQSGLRQFGIGIGHPRNGVVVDPHRQAEQRVPDHQAGVIIGGMRELQLPGGDVADRVDAPIGWS